MTQRTITLPLYLLENEDLEGLIAKSMEIMTELAGESDTPELPSVIVSLRNELALRGKPIHLNEDGTFSAVDPDSEGPSLP